jgi:adenine-specific DNA methylase
MFDAVPAYLGGKRAILAQIFREVARHIDPSRWKQSTFIDGFVGGGSVSIYAKAQFASVVGNDLADRSAMVARALLVNNDTRLAHEDAILLVEGADSPTNYTATQQADWFTPTTARFIDRALAYAATVADPVKADLLRTVVWQVILHSRPTAGGDFTSRNLVERAMAGELAVSGIAGAKYAFRTPTIRDVVRICSATNGGVFRGRYGFTQADALEASATWNADVVYLDPPYAGDTTYESRYKIADACMQQHDVPVGLGVSPFSDKKRAEAAISQVIRNVAAAGAKLVLLDNSNEAISRERLLGIMGEHYYATEVPLIHSHTSANAHGKDGDVSGSTEVFIVGSRL